MPMLEVRALQSSPISRLGFIFDFVLGVLEVPRVLEVPGVWRFWGFQVFRGGLQVSGVLEVPHSQRWILRFWRSWGSGGSRGSRQPEMDLVVLEVLGFWRFQRFHTSKNSPEVLEDVPEQPWFLRFLRLTTDLLPRLRVFEGSCKVPQRFAKRT